MLLPPADIVALLSPFAPLFSRRIWRHVLELDVGPFWRLLAMLALAYLAVVRYRLPGDASAGVSDLNGGPPWPPVLHWSHWRWQHQARAQRCHYRRRLAQQRH